MNTLQQYTQFAWATTSHKASHEQPWLYMFMCHMHARSISKFQSSSLDHVLTWSTATKQSLPACMAIITHHAVQIHECTIIPILTDTNNSQQKVQKIRLL